MQSDDAASSLSAVNVKIRHPLKEYLSCQREQNFIGEHLEVGVFPQSAAVQLVVDDGVVNEASPVDEPVRHFLSDTFQVDARKRFEVRQNLRLLGGTLHDALPHGGVVFGTVAVFVINRA